MTEPSKLRPCILPSCHGKRFELVHKFPCNNKRAERWLQEINYPELRKYDLDTIRKRMFICYRHFRVQDYKNKESRILNKTAVPTLLLSSSNNINQVDFPNLNDKNDKQDEPEYLLNLTEEYLYDEFDKDTQDIKEIVQELSPMERIDSQIIKDTIESSTRTSSSQSRLLNNAHLQQKHLSLLVKNTTKPINKSSGVFSIKKPASNLKKLQKLKIKPVKLNSIVSNTNQSTITTKLSMANIKKDIDDDNLVATSLNNHHEQRNYQLEDDVPLAIIVADQIEEFSAPISSHQNLNFNQLKTDEFIKIKSQHYPDELKLNNFWLRDHCNCKNCFDPETNQRKYNLLDIPLNITPVRQLINEDQQLMVLWSDDHNSEYDVKKLYDQHFDKTVDRLMKFHKNNIKLWTKSIIENTSDYARVKLIDYLDDNKTTARSVVASLVNYGCAFIENVPANNMSSTEIVIKHLFSVQKTLFGEMFTLTSNKYHADTAYQQGYLPAHTDNTYFNNAAGLIALHCTKHLNCVGGESLLLDGFKVLEDFSKKYPDSYRRLCETSVPAIYLEDKQNHQYSAPIIRLNPITKLPEQIRFNLSDRSLFNTLPQEKMPEFYKDLYLLTEMIQTKSYEWWFKLVPGTVMIFNNWRLLHGRKAFTGQRVLTGCYISQTEFQSVARNMGLFENS